MIACSFGTALVNQLSSNSRMAASRSDRSTAPVNESASDMAPMLRPNHTAVIIRGGVFRACGHAVD